MFKQLTVTLAFAALIAASPVLADVPPEKAKPLSAITDMILQKDLGIVTEGEFENGYWELLVTKDAEQYELYVEPLTMEVRRRVPVEIEAEMPPAERLELSEVMRKVEDLDVGTIVEFEFDNGYWEIELRRGSKIVKMDIDPVTGDRLLQAAKMAA